MRKVIASKSTDLFLAYQRNGVDPFELYKQSFSDFYLGNTDDLNILKQFFCMKPEITMWWKAFSTPVVYKYDKIKLEKAVSKFHEFIRYISINSIILNNDISTIVAFQNDGGHSLKLIQEMLQESRFKQEQMDSLHWVPKRIERQVFERHSISYFTPELLRYCQKSQLMKSKDRIVNSDNLKAYIYKCLYDLKCKQSKVSISFKDLGMFFKSIEHADEQRQVLTMQEQALVIRILLNIDLTSATIGHLLAMSKLAKSIKYKLGNTEFLALFNSTSHQLRPGFNYFIDALGCCVEFYNKVNLLPDLHAYGRRNFNINELFNRLDQLKQGWWASQKEPIDLKTLVTRCKGGASEPDVEYPIDPKELSKIDRQMQTLNMISDKLRTQQIKTIKESLDSIIRQTSLDEESRLINILAHIRFVIRHYFGIFPYDLQVIVVLGLIQHNKSLKGRLAQVKTGEGKSTIVTLLATYFALNNKNVDILTSSESLAIRDYEKYKDYYDFLGISSSHVCYDVQDAKCFEPKINFSTTHHIQWAIIRDQLNEEKVRVNRSTGEPRAFDIVLIDEIDNLLIDKAQGGGCIGHFSTEPNQNTWVFSSVINFYKLNKNKIHSDFNSSLKACIDSIKTIALQRKHQLNLPDIIIGLYLKTAIDVMELNKEGRDYLIKEKKIHIVDWENTGKVLENNRWRGGKHELVEAKHNIVPDEKFMTIAQIEQSTFYGFYDRIFGLTGTIGGDEDRKEIMAVYNLDSFDVPTYNPCQRINKTHIITKTLDEQLHSIYSQSISITRNGRPVLILLKSIEDSIQLSELFKENQLEHQMYNGIQSIEESFILARAGHPGVITIATNTAGRGTDIIVSKLGKKNGGLHTIIGFFPGNIRVEVQAYGRAGRQGQPGSWQFILSHDEEKSYNAIFKGLSDKLIGDTGAYFSMIYKKRSKKIIEESNGRKNSADNSRYLFEFLKRFFDINTKTEHLKEQAHKTFLTQVLTKSVCIEDVSLALTKNEEELKAQFQQMLDSNGDMRRQRCVLWIGAFIKYIKNKLTEDWCQFFDLSSNLLHAHGQFEIFKVLSKHQFQMEIEEFSKIFFNRYHYLQNRPYYFIGKCLLSLGIQFNHINQHGEDGYTKLLIELKHKNKSMVDLLMGNGAFIDLEYKANDGFGYSKGFEQLGYLTELETHLNPEELKSDFSIFELSNASTAASGDDPSVKVLERGHESSTPSNQAQVDDEIQQFIEADKLKKKCGPNVRKKLEEMHLGKPETKIDKLIFIACEDVIKMKGEQLRKKPDYFNQKLGEFRTRKGKNDITIEEVISSWENNMLKKKLGLK